jgi:heme-degrading monooxygenase HmoA
MLANFSLMSGRRSVRLNQTLALAASASLATASLAQPGVASDVPHGAPMVVIVKVAKPWYAPKALVASKMRDTVEQYATMPGLLFKAYSFAREDGAYGGIYFWQDGASVRQWFNPGWFERVRQERGVDGQVRFFAAPVSIENLPGGTPVSLDSSAVATLVQLPVPAGVSKDQIRAEFTKAIPAYRAVPGLLRKHFIVSEQGTLGGVYLWQDEASAKAWFSESWHQKVRTIYGVDARIEWFDTPILLPSKNPAPVGLLSAQSGVSR